jgi:hypothetical protein
MVEDDMSNFLRTKFVGFDERKINTYGVKGIK